MDPLSLPDLTHTPTTAGHGPYEHTPAETFIAPTHPAAMLTTALDGVTLGTWDQRIADWLCHWSDTPTFLAILGWIERARATNPTPTGQALVEALVRLASVAGDFWNHAHNLLGTLEHLAATDPDAAVLHAQTELLIDVYDQAKATYDQTAAGRQIGDL